MSSKEVFCQTNATPPRSGVAKRSQLRDLPFLSN